MRRKMGKKVKRRLLFLFSLTLMISIFILFNLGKIWILIYTKAKEEKFLREEIVRLKKEEINLKKEVNRLQDPDYVARYARERYLYSRDGEFTIRIP
ncbi:MAG: FtsB family cell division protein [Bacilli bacterium]|jgi:cell division protein DivIC